MHVAALGSLLIHAALLSLPLGETQRSGRTAIKAGSTIHAFLRPPPAEPTAVVATPAAPPKIEEAVTEPAPPVPRPRASPQPQEAETSASNARPAPIPATYFDPSRLTEPPRPLEEPPVDRLLRMMARPGVANLVLYIDETGTVTSAEIDESSTLPPAVNEQAAALFRAIRFSPGRIDGTPVKTRVRITLGLQERTPQN